MPQRRLRIVKTSPTTLGVCERCGRQFSSHSPVERIARIEIKALFNVHKCRPIDSSQNALRIVREATEDK